MKLITNNQNKETVIKNIDIVLSIDELDDLIKFLNYTKKQFVKRKSDNAINQLQVEEGKISVKKISSFEEIVSLGKNIIEEHMHFQDWYNSKYHKSTEMDIVVHTIFEAEQSFEDSFIWANIINDNIHK